MKAFLSGLALAALIVCVTAVSDDKTDKKEGAVVQPVLPVFQPAPRGAPKMRVGGGIRGLHEADVELAVMAPEQLGVTLQSQPTLYWSVSRPVKQPLEITLVDKRTVLLRIQRNGVEHVGMQTIRLAEHKVSLMPDHPYRWSVAIVNDPRQRSKDIFASAGIMRVAENGLQARLDRADAQQRISIYAEQGFWYDAFAEAESLAEKNPGDPMLSAIKNHLLRQVGLSVMP